MPGRCAELAIFVLFCEKREARSGLNPAAQRIPMPLTAHRISPGYLAEVYQEGSNRLRAGEAVQKMWARQAGLWKDDPEHARIIANRLGWIGVLDSMRAEAAALQDHLARDIKDPGGNHIVLPGKGGPSLAPEVFSLTFPAPSRGRFFLLDSPCPP